MEFTRPRGTRDFLFEEMRERKQAESTLRKVFESYGYQEIKTPLFEEVIYCEGADLFVVNTLNPDGSIKQHVDGVYLDCLVNVIDEMVETI